MHKVFNKIILLSYENFNIDFLFNQSQNLELNLLKPSLQKKTYLIMFYNYIYLFIFFLKKSHIF